MKLYSQPSRLRTGLVAAVVVLCAGLCAAPGQAGDLLGADPSDAPRFRIDLGSGFAAARVDGSGFRPLAADVAPASGSKQSFYHRHFLPRLNQQFERFSAYRVVPESGTALGDYVLFDQLTDLARSRSERATSRALRNYVLETTAVGRLLRGVGSDVVGTATARALRERPVRFGVGLSHGLPRAELRYGTGGTLVRLGVVADGSARLGLHFGRAHEGGVDASLGLGYDARDDEYGLSCRIAF